MPGSIFIGRQDELQQLHNLIIQAMNHHGGTIFIEGTEGMQKTKLIDEFVEQCNRDQDLEEWQFIDVLCQQDSGHHISYHPFIEILERFKEPSDNNRKFVEKALKIYQRLVTSKQ